MFKKVQWMEAETCPVALALELGARRYVTDLRDLLVSSLATDDCISDGVWKHAGDLCEMSDGLEEIYVTQSKLRKLGDKVDAPRPADDGKQVLAIASELKQVLDHLRCILRVLHSRRIHGPRGIVRDLVWYSKNTEESNLVLFSRVQQSWRRHLHPHALEESLGKSEVDVAAKVMQVARIIQESGFGRRRLRWDRFCSSAQDCRGPGNGDGDCTRTA
jgi:hypothetical protein